MAKKILVIVLCGILVISSFVGCGNTKNTSDESTVQSSTQSSAAAASETKAVAPVELSFLENSANGGQEETLKTMIADFNTKNPNIKIKYEIVAYKDYYTKLNTLLSAGKAAPDIFEVGYENFGQYAAKGMIKDLTALAASDKNINTKNMKKLAYDAFKYDGKQYGMCTDYTGVVMFYNKDLFDSKSVAYPTASWTWKDELEAAQKLTDTAKGIWGTVAPLQTYEFYKTIAQNGGSFWSADGKNVTINNKESVEALQWMLDKSNKYKVQPSFTSDIYTQPDADVKAFIDGKIAMFRTGNWQFGNFEKNVKFKWDIALEPGNTSKGHHFFANGLVVSKDAKNGDAAWVFLKYMSTDVFATNQRIEKGWNVPVLNNEEIMSVYYKKTPPESKKVVTDILDSLVLPPLGAVPDKWSEVSKIVGDELDKAKFGKATAQEALDAAKIKLEELIK